MTEAKGAARGKAHSPPSAENRAKAALISLSLMDSNAARLSFLTAIMRDADAARRRALEEAARYVAECNTDHHRLLADGILALTEREASAASARNAPPETSRAGSTEGKEKP